MISALSAQDTRKSAHAGQRAKQSQTPAPQPVSTDDPNGLPAAPDGSNNQQTQTTTNNQPTIFIIKEKPWWQKALPWVAAGLVGIAGTVFSLHGLGNKFLKENADPYANKLVKPDSRYKKECLDPLFNIADALKDHLASNPSDKETITTLRDKLGIGENKAGNPLIEIIHGIPLGEKEVTTTILSTTENFKEALEIAKNANLPKGIIENLEHINSYSANDPKPHSSSFFTSSLSFGRNEKGEIQFVPFDNRLRQNIYVGGQIIKHTVQGWANKLINRLIQHQQLDRKKLK